MNKVEKKYIKIIDDKKNLNNKVLILYFIPFVLAHYLLYLFNHLI